MLFHTSEFAAFLAILLALVAVVRGATARKVVLLAASYTFYAWWSVVMLLPLLATTFLDFFVAQLIEREKRPKQRKALLILSLTANLGLLAFFKYVNFFATTMGMSPIASILLPIGISFYTFHTMSYTIDVYRREIPACRSALDFALFITFFPVLVAGPILRAKQFLPQLREPIRIRVTPEVLMLFVRGLAKKVLVADNLAPLADQVFAEPARWPSVIIWTATLAFAIQMYCDFSGYSDMARALAALFGFDIPLNFDRPYLARNPREFWRRWHISLSSWLRDYLYIPLGGNRHHHARNIVVTMTLGGLWHGASWNFVLWGFLHGVLLLVSRRLPRVAFWYALLFTWIAFRVRETHAMLVAMRKFVVFDFDFHLANRGLTGMYLMTSVVLIAAFLATHAWSNMRGDLDVRIARLPLAAALPAAIAIGAVFLYFWPPARAPFIYFQF
ncbi:MAG TPA: MBOAT family O-acyltransferase [Thermoanaerobaculia bacterium]|nr:MBOAT family O-acyltransferase [Thermoanaerobaculia bacterium]